MSRQESEKEICDALLSAEESRLERCDENDRDNALAVQGEN